MNSKKHYFKLILISVGTMILSYGLSLQQSQYLTTTHYWIPSLFFLITTLLSNKLLTKGENESKEFIFKSLAMSMGRLLICMIFVFIYSLLYKEQALAFTCHFMIAYLIFTVFEISFLLKYIKQTN
jgi:hypothetical protein